MLEPVPLFRVHMPPGDELMPALGKVLQCGYITQGPAAADFEDGLAAYLGTGVLAVSSCTAAIQLALRLAGVAGGSVITTPVTCAATNMPVLAEGARIIWADVDPATGSIDAGDAARKIAPDTRAIMAVHWGGQPADMAALAAAAAPRGIRVIEDAAHALGSRQHGVMTGAGTADFTAFSFQAIKHITTGDGGALACRDPADAARGKLLRWYGMDREVPREAQDAAEWGYKSHMNDIAATIGLAQLPHLPAIVAAHRANAAYYAMRFAGRVTSAAPLAGADGAWWLYTVLLPEPGMQEEFAAHMRSRGIQVSCVHRRNDHLACFAPYAAGPLPGTDDFCSRMSCIPVHWALSPADRDRVAAAVLDFCEVR